jgi:hypothetical protein
MEKLIDKDKKGTVQKLSAGHRRNASAGEHEVERHRLNIKPLCAALIAAAVLTACGGGGGDSPSAAQPDTSSGGTPSPGTPSTGTPPTSPGAVAGATTMSCADGAGFQCSGGGIIRTDNGVSLSSSGVQVYGKSTSDLAANNTMKTSALGFALEDGNGVAEMRVAKNAAGNVTTAALLLSNLGLSWDGRTERPPIIETFRTTLSRTQLNASGALAFGTLPDPSDLNFYDFATRGTSGTQANYANNAYFPRPNNPSRCPADVTPCPSVESSGLQNQAGDWRTGGTTPDWVSAGRLHEDGDVHAGNGTPGPNGTVTILSGGTGVGVPFPGSKGYRNFSNWGLQYANLGTWVSQDTVLIEEWANLGNEHNKNRRGIIAFGDVTAPASVPTTGTATYTGIAYGWYGNGTLTEPPVFRGTATVTVNFATRQATVSVQSTSTFDAAGTAVPATFTATTALGAAGANVANYLTGTATNGTLSGGVGGRLFGPVVATGSSGTGPAEIAGAFRMSAASGVAVIGGFIGRKQ